MTKLTYPHEDSSVKEILKAQMDVNGHKGDTWKTCSTMHLRDKLVEEFAEIVLDPYNPQELADLANICCMLIWRFRNTL